MRSSRVVTPDGMRDAVVSFRDGVIVSVEQPQEIPSDRVEDFGDLVISPGLIDPHVHINEPGRTEWEGFETATRSAAAAGVTTLVDMPLNSSPVTTSVVAFQTKLNASERKLHVDCGFHAGLVPANAGNLKSLLASGVLGVKAFMIHSGIDDFPATTESDFHNAMHAIAEAGIPLLVHAELQPRDFETRASNPRSYEEYLSSRPRNWENDAVAMMIRLCKEYRCRVHIVHVSSSEAIPLLRNAKEAGLPITAETCPHYLYFDSETIPDGDTRLKCAPPIRERENNEKLWDALREGVLDFVASDHSPCSPEMKFLGEGNFMKAWGGIASLQFGLPIVWTLTRERGLTPENLSSMMSANPAKLIGLENRKGRIAAGFDADFVVWDPDESFVVEPSIVHHRHKLTPYEGRRLFGKVYTTFLHGSKVFSEGTFSSPSGRVILQ
jgi:allantoinase